VIIQAFLSGVESLSLCFLPALPRINTELNSNPFCIPVGNSALLNLLFYTASQLSIDVVLHHAGMFIFVFLANGTVRIHDESDAWLIPELFDHRTLYLFDPDEKDTQARKCTAFTVISTNQDVRHFSNHIKHGGVHHLLSPPWTKEELIAAHRALQPGGILSEEQVAEIEQRYDEVGGLIRYSLYSDEAYARIRQCLPHIAKNKISLSSLREWFATVQIGNAAHTFWKTHLYFHLFPSSVNIGIASVSFASDKSAEHILETIVVESVGEWQQLVNFMRSIDPQHPCLREKYGTYIHAYMRNYSVLPEFTVFELSHPEDANSAVGKTLEEIPEYKRSESPNKNIADALSSGQCTYIVPVNAENALADSFYVLGNTVYCFQLRAGDAISCDAEECERAMDQIHRLCREEKSLAFKLCRIMNVTERQWESYRESRIMHVDEVLRKSVDTVGPHADLLFSQLSRGKGVMFFVHYSKVLNGVNSRRRKRARRVTQGPRPPEDDE